MNDDFLRVFRPLLPAADQIGRYLARIDASRYYTNRGPLVQELESRLAALFGIGPEAIRTTSTGTSAIEVAILAHAGAAAARKLALMPSFTFAATAFAAERCGYQVHFVDIDPTSWALEPEALASHPLLSEAGLILSVAPFGKMPEIGALERLQAASGVSVILDAAAGFEAFAEGRARVSKSVPQTLSFHATKGFSTGEGGAVLWDDAAGQDRVEQAANFGFLHSREAKTAGTNAKLSEFHAAIGLAMLDSLAKRQQAHAAQAAAWAATAARHALPGPLHLAPDLAPVYVLLEAETEALATALQAHLYDNRVETRRWYETGLAEQPWFASAGRDALPITAALSGRLIGLPTALDLTADKIDLVLGLIEAMPREARRA